MSKIYLGADLGLHGALIALDQNVITGTYEMPVQGKEVDFNSLHKILKMYQNRDCHVIFERLGVIFRSSKKTAFTMGTQYGAMQALCISLGMSYSMIPPKTWQKEMFEGIKEITRVGKNRDTTDMEIKKVKQIVQEEKLTGGTRATVPHAGMVYSILLAKYGQIKNL